MPCRGSRSGPGRSRWSLGPAGRTSRCPAPSASKSPAASGLSATRAAAPSRPWPESSHASSLATSVSACATVVAGSRPIARSGTRVVAVHRRQQRVGHRPQVGGLRPQRGQRRGLRAAREVPRVVDRVAEQDHVARRRPPPGLVGDRRGTRGSPPPKAGRDRTASAISSKRHRHGLAAPGSRRRSTSGRAASRKLAGRSGGSPPGSPASRSVASSALSTRGREEPLPRGHEVAPPRLGAEAHEPAGRFDPVSHVAGGRPVTSSTIAGPANPRHLGRARLGPGALEGARREPRRTCG